jgi:hypothetical protein
VLAIDGVSVVSLDDWVEELVESRVGAVTASIKTDRRVDVLASREDAELEGNTAVVSLVLVLFPDLLGKVLGKEGLSAFGEEGEVYKVIDTLEPRATVSTAWGRSRLLQSFVSVFRSSATHWECFYF